MAQIKFKAGDKLEWRDKVLDDKSTIDVKPQRVYVGFKDRDGKDCGACEFSSDMLAQFATAKPKK